MKNIVELADSKYLELPFLNKECYKKEFDKGWSFISVYDLGELRDVFLALCIYDQVDFEIGDFSKFCLEIDLPFVKTQWNPRRLLEHINALKSFSLIDQNGLVRDTELFRHSTIGSALNLNELEVFRRIYFSYFRFKEVFSWFMPILAEGSSMVEELTESKICAESQPLFTFSQGGRFTNCFLKELKDGTTVYYISDKNGDLMRFWDVFVKWGLTLSVIEKFNLKSLGTVDGSNLSCSYVIDNTFSSANFDLIYFINSKYKEYYIYIPQLVCDIALEIRQSIDVIHKILISQYRINKSLISFERTSEIFISKREIKDHDKILFLKYQDSYVSYLIIRR